MAIKGAESKSNITKEILSYFGDRAFLYNDGKEIRVDCMENGVPVQIKIALTAAKEAVERGADVALPAAAPAQRADRIDFESGVPTPTATITEPTAEEKVNIAELMKKLGL